MNSNKERSSNLYFKRTSVATSNKIGVIMIFTDWAKARYKERFLIDEPMSKHTSFGVGGPAKYMVLPHNTEEIVETIRYCYGKNIEYIVIGNGSNLLVSDQGIDKLVIKISKEFSNIVVDGDLIYADSGLLLSKLSNVALENGLSGLEFASGIPGNVGGAVSMNAGAYDGEMKDVIKNVTVVDDKGELVTFSNKELEFGYRNSLILKKGFIVVAAEFKLKPLNKEFIKEKMTDFNNRRKEKQPLELKSAGSTFKRPDGYYAGKLIMDANLKGYRIGGASVSEKHCGFVVNDNNATAKDVKELIEYVQKVVFEKHGVILETEVKMIGF